MTRSHIPIDNEKLFVILERFFIIWILLKKLVSKVILNSDILYIEQAAKWNKVRDTMRQALETSSLLACATELMNAATSFHKLHLKVKGAGSYAAHKALNDLYDALPGHADTLIEGYQGASEKLLDYKEVAPRTLNTVADAIDYLKEMSEMVNGLQAKMPYSEIVNSLDTLKDTINSA